MTRFRRGSPTPRFQEGFTMFGTRPLEYQRKLTEGNIRDFASPAFLHTFKVERLYRNRIILSHKTQSQLEEPVSPLLRDFLMNTGEVAFRTIPRMGTLLLARECLVC